jgi:hypothetical protein
MDLTPAKENKSSLGLAEDYQLGRTYYRSLIETKEDGDFAQWVKGGKDPDLLE